MLSYFLYTDLCSLEKAPLRGSEMLSEMLVSLGMDLVWVGGCVELSIVEKNMWHICLSETSLLMTNSTIRP